MIQFGPGDGREKTPEEIADDMMNQSDEGVEDLLEGTEISSGDDYDSGYDDESSATDLFGDPVDGSSDSSDDDGDFYD